MTLCVLGSIKLFICVSFDVIIWKQVMGSFLWLHSIFSTDFHMDFSLRVLRGNLEYSIFLDFTFLPEYYIYLHMPESKNELNDSATAE